MLVFMTYPQKLKIKGCKTLKAAQDHIIIKCGKKNYVIDLPDASKSPSKHCGAICELMDVGSERQLKKKYGKRMHTSDNIYFIITKKQ
jgi:hypothetical protein